MEAFTLLAPTCMVATAAENPIMAVWSDKKGPKWTSLCTLHAGFSLCLLARDRIQLLVFLGLFILSSRNEQYLGMMQGLMASAAGWVPGWCQGTAPGRRLQGERKGGQHEGQP